MNTLTKARTRPRVLDDATIDRIDQVHTEQMEFVGIYDQQISRWRTETSSEDQTRELNGRRNRTDGSGPWLRMSSRWPANSASTPSSAS